MGVAASRCWLWETPSQNYAPVLPFPGFAVRFTPGYYFLP